MPVDKNIECFDVFNLRPQKDLFYAMSHGVNRAILKEGSEDDRIIFLNNLVKKFQKLNMIFTVLRINSLFGVITSLDH